MNRELSNKEVLAIESQGFLRRGGYLQWGKTGGSKECRSKRFTHQFANIFCTMSIKRKKGELAGRKTVS